MNIEVISNAGFTAVLDEYRGMLRDDRAARALVDWVEGLPPMPAIATRALSLLNDENCDIEELAETVSYDPSIAAQILRYANSAATSQRRAVTSLKDGLQIIGLGRLKGVLIATVTRGLNKGYGAVEELIWSRSIGTAVAARIFGRVSRASDPDFFHLTGLLHNLGQLVMLSDAGIRHDYGTVLELLKERGGSVSQIEREVIGFSYPLVGALIAKKWGFSMQLCQIILNHENPFEPDDMEERKNLARLKMAITLSEMAGIGVMEGAALDLEFAQITLELFSLNEGHDPHYLDKLVQMTAMQFTAEKSAFLS
jgi:HD-like signal output (HDOD) protein